MTKCASRCSKQATEQAASITHLRVPGGGIHIRWPLIGGQGSIPQSAEWPRLRGGGGGESH